MLNVFFYAMDVTIVTVGAYYFDVLFDCVFNKVIEILFSIPLVIAAFGFRFI